MQIVVHGLKRVNQVGFYRSSITYCPSHIDRLALRLVLARAGPEIHNEGEDHRWFHICSFKFHTVRAAL